MKGTMMRRNREEETPFYMQQLDSDVQHFGLCTTVRCIRVSMADSRQHTPAHHSSSVPPIDAHLLPSGALWLRPSRREEA